MMHIYICPVCKKAFMVSRRIQAACRNCGQEMWLSQIEFNDWVNMSTRERAEQIMKACEQPEGGR